MSGRKIKLDPPFLDEEERETIEAFHEALDKGTLVSRLTTGRKAELQEIVRHRLAAPRKSVTARVPERDLARLKARASEEGVSLQTLLASIVHRYIEGDLIDRSRTSDRPRIVISGSRAWSTAAARQRRLYRSGHAAAG